MAFAKGLHKVAAALPKAKAVLAHMGRHRKDYLMGAAAAGSLGTAYGANKGKK